MSLTGNTTEQKIWNYLKGKGLNDCGTAALMGNLYAESALKPENLQNVYETKLGYTDSEYTAAVDNGSYKDFVNDSAGYGLAQWTYWSRKQGLLNFACAEGKSIGDLETQLGFLYKELSEGYKSVLEVLKTATTVLQASNVVLTQFERPANQGSSVQEARAKYGQAYYDKYAEKSNAEGGTKMNLRKLILTNNACYKAGKTISIKGIMVHSTGANNPNLKRYVGPDDGLLGKNTNNNHWNQDKPDGRQVCVHAFIGKLADGSVATYQTLPWNYQGWHCGSGSKGSGNDTHIGFEICEDGLTDSTYFGKVYQEAVELCVHLCKEYSLNPLADGVLICHSEGYKRGVATNHADVMHWFPRHGKTMDDFRKDVKTALAASESSGGATTPPAPESPSTGQPATSNGAFSVGDVVQFKGGSHYTNANATSAAGSPAAGPAKLTAISTGAKHPYHVIHTDGSSAVYGWVDENSLATSGGGTESGIYTVKAGDSLWGIADQLLNDGSRYPEIKALNGLTSDTITPGQKLKIPGGSTGNSSSSTSPAKTVSVGSTVRLKSGAKTYTGGGLASFVYSRDHVVSDLKGDRAVITYGGVTVAAVRVSDLTVK
nr:MAG TPA: PGRP protein [Caudoviricetes sp.]